MEVPPAAVAPDGAGRGAQLFLKVVPGASRTAFAGAYGDRLKVRVAAPPENGKANRALLDFLAERLGLPRAALRVAQGEGAPLKTVLVSGWDAAALRARLSEVSS